MTAPPLEPAAASAPGAPAPLAAVQQLDDALSMIVSPGLLRFTGEIDLATAQAFRVAVAAEARRQGRRLVLDLGEVHFLDSSGLGALYTLTRETDIDVVLTVRAGSIVDRVIEVSGMQRVLRMQRVTRSA